MLGRQASSSGLEAIAQGQAREAEAGARGISAFSFFPSNTGQTRIGNLF